MEPTPEVIAALYREEIIASRRQSPEEKMLAGGRLFDELCERMKSELRVAHPEADEDTITRLLSERLQAERDAEEKGIYVPVDSRAFPIPPP